VVSQLFSDPQVVEKRLSDLKTHLSVMPVPPAIPQQEGAEPSSMDLAGKIARDLDTRIEIWRSVLRIAPGDRSAAAQRIGDSPADAVHLASLTDRVDSFLEATPTGDSWRAFLEIARLQQSLGEEGGREHFPEGRRRRISSVACLVLERIARTSLSEKQYSVLQHPVLAGWLEALQQWVGPPVALREMLAILERFEWTHLPSDGERLLEFQRRLAISDDPARGQLGEKLAERYTRANLHVYISEIFLNRILPPQEPEYDTVRDVVVGRPVFGRRLNETDVAFRLIPNDHRLLLSLIINGRVRAATSSSSGPATLHNESFVRYTARRTVEWTTHGFHLMPAEVAVDNRVQLRRVDTDFDPIPFVGDLVREVAISQYQQQRSQIAWETKHKAHKEAKLRIESESDERFLQINQRLDSFVLDPLDRMDLHMHSVGSRTTDQWLMALLRLSSTPAIPTGHTKPPATPHGLLADAKIHESAVNTFLKELDLAGEALSIRQIRERLAQRLKWDELAEMSDENDDILIQFAEEDPIFVRFEKDRLRIEVAIRAMKRGNQIWQNFRGIVFYTTAFDTTGSPVLQRDGVVRLIGKMSLRTQIPLRAMFGKIFPKQRQIPLRPKFIETNPRFAGLTTGMCRLERGWFALGLMPTDLELEKTSSEFAAREEMKTQ
jgi:hypothetical protein